MAKLAKVKTHENMLSVDAFIQSVEDEKKIEDSIYLLNLMQKLSGKEPKMWGSSIIGFGKLIHKSPTSGREVEWFDIGFSPRKANMTIYFMNLTVHAADLEKLGKYKAGKGCIYIRKLEDVNLDVLETMIKKTLAATAG